MDNRSRRSRRLMALAWLVLEDPSLLHFPRAVAEALKVSYANAKMILCRYRKLDGNSGNRLCPGCLAVLKILADSLLCDRCGFERSLPRIIVPTDSSHEKQSGIWGNGTQMSARELKRVAPSLKMVFSTKEERLKRAVLSELEEVLKSFTLSSDQTTCLAQRALFHFRILVNEKGKSRVYKAVCLSLLDGASMNPILSLGLRNYMSSGSYYSARKQKKRKLN